MEDPLLDFAVAAAVLAPFILGAIFGWMGRSHLVFPLWLFGCFLLLLATVAPMVVVAVMTFAMMSAVLSIVIL